MRLNSGQRRTERGTRNLRPDQGREYTPRYVGLTATQKRVQKKFRSRKRRYFTQTEVPGI